MITSDYQLIAKDAMHRIFSINFPKLRKFPRIFIYDCCDGDYERGTDSKHDIGKNGNEVGKNVGSSTRNILFIEEVKDIDIWCHDDRNPDYKLVTIHAANIGFQSKLSLVVISKFVDVSILYNDAFFFWICVCR